MMHLTTTVEAQLLSSPPNSSYQLVKGATPLLQLFEKVYPVGQGEKEDETLQLY